MKPDYLYDTQYIIEQPDEMFHMNSDTELLGRFAKILHKDDVLDIGCGNGALLLYAAKAEPASLTGVDIADQIVDAAQKNLALNRIKGEIVKSRIQNYHPDRCFSVILCNPPYFATLNDKLVNEKPLVAMARHELNLSPEELFKSCKRLLKDNGTFYLVHRPAHLEKILRIAHENGFHAVRMRFAYDTMHSEAKTVLYAFKKGKSENCRIEKPYFLSDRDSF